MKTLHLSLKKLPFDVMVTGEKTEEFRIDSAWIISRMFNKDGTPKNYDVIKFTNGYGSDKPYFICNYEGFRQNVACVPAHTYSNGFEFEGMADNNFIIYLGLIIETGNLKTTNQIVNSR